MLCVLRRHAAQHSASSTFPQAEYSAHVDTKTIQRPYRLHRRQRLAALRDAAGGPKELARLLYGREDANDTHIIACLKGRRDVGDELASDLEKAAGKPPGWMDSDPALDAGGPAVSGRAAYIGQQLDAIRDHLERDRAMVLCENFAALAQAGQLQAALTALQVMAPAALAGAPSEPPPQHHQPQSAGGRAAPT